MNTGLPFETRVLVDGENGIIAGHGRVLAAQSLGLEQVPCIELAGLTAAQQRAYRLADNKLALNAGWDVDLLAAELGELQDLGFDLGTVGFSLEEIDELFAPAATEGETDPDATPEPPERPVATRGEPRKGTVTYLNLHFPSSPGMPCERPCR